VEYFVVFDEANEVQTVVKQGKCCVPRPRACRCGSRVDLDQLKRESNKAGVI
jgi:hypothetical protein